jgi:heptose-I-phosphate ethanolaminephosphotransferase
VLYFSDHGEEVFDEIDYAGHSVDQNITKNMFEVPFVLWQSKAFQKEHNIEQDTDVKFSLEYLAHAIADLCGVQSNTVDYSRSLFNKSFESSPRIILDSINYDLKFVE